MPELVRFTIFHMSYGALLGTVTVIVMILISPDALGHGSCIHPLALLLQLYAFSAAFALGSLATALAMLGEP
ncbi:hypothetical protein [Ensifer sp. 4252]|uniref:hypothetical protein n=1 Tax=Ensifer sp. 4252 TaxID=3373915 RepID=UPI003D21474F